MLASLVYTNKPEGFTNEDARRILGDDHFDLEDFEGTKAFSGDDEYYQYPQLVMLNDLPRALSDLGEINSGRVDSWLEIPVSKEQEMLDIADRHDFKLIRDDALALAVDLFTDERNRFDRERFRNTVELLQQHLS